MGVFHVKGWGPESSVCPKKTRENNLLAGYPGVPRKLGEIDCVQFLGPIPFQHPRLPCTLARGIVHFL